MTDERVHCDLHGEQDATFVCQHLVASLGDRTPRGYVVDPDEDVERPDAWCHECDVVLTRHGGEWNDASEAFAGVSVLCARCYDEAKRLNSAVPTPA